MHSQRSRVSSFLQNSLFLSSPLAAPHEPTVCHVPPVVDKKAVNTTALELVARARGWHIAHNNGQLWCLHADLCSFISLAFDGVPIWLEGKSLGLDSLVAAVEHNMQMSTPCKLDWWFQSAGNAQHQEIQVHCSSVCSQVNPKAELASLCCCLQHC